MCTSALRWVLLPMSFPVLMKARCCLARSALLQAATAVEWVSDLIAVSAVPGFSFAGAVGRFSDRVGSPAESLLASIGPIRTGWQRKPLAVRGSANPSTPARSAKVKALVLQADFAVPRGFA
jgi:hypothetical protein